MNIFPVFLLSAMLLFSGSYVSGLPSSATIQNETSQEAEPISSRESIITLSQANQIIERSSEIEKIHFTVHYVLKSDKGVSQDFSFKDPIFIRHCALLI